MIEKLTDEERERFINLHDAIEPEMKVLRIIDQQAKALAAAEARIAAATEILLGSCGHLASEALAALRGER